MVVITCRDSYKKNIKHLSSKLNVPILDIEIDFAPQKIEVLNIFRIYQLLSFFFQITSLLVNKIEAVKWQLLFCLVVNKISVKWQLLFCSLVNKIDAVKWQLLFCLLVNKISVKWQLLFCLLVNKIEAVNWQLLFCFQVYDV